MTPADPVREALARIIDPDRWARFDHYSGPARADAGDDDCAWMTRESLDKADACLAVINAPDSPFAKALAEREALRAERDEARAENERLKAELARYKAAWRRELND